MDKNQNLDNIIMPSLDDSRPKKILKALLAFTPLLLSASYSKYSIYLPENITEYMSNKEDHFFYLGLTATIGLLGWFVYREER